MVIVPTEKIVYIIPKQLLRGRVLKITYFKLLRRVNARYPVHLNYP